MALREELDRQGRWLFKWRSYLPLVLVPMLIIGLQTEHAYGDSTGNALKALGVVLSFAGFLVRCLVIGYVPAGTSGRNRSKQVANTLNTKGMYAVVRNPLYLGNFIIISGVLIFAGDFWSTLTATLLFWLYYERIIFTEEEFLRGKFGDTYLEWAKMTPAFIPNFRKWEAPALYFSFKNVLKREYSGFFGIVGIFTLLEFTENVIKNGELSLDFNWILFFSISLIIYLILRALRKHTKLLNVADR